MKLFIDSANVDQIRQLNEYFLIDGVTTNPTIITKEQKAFLPLLKEIRAVIGEEKLLFIQTIAERAEEMIEEAQHLTEVISGNIVIKIPVTREGVKAIKQLRQQEIRTLATTVYTPMNAYVAAKAGADYVAPYVNRIDNLTGNGVQVVKDIAGIFYNANLNCEILAASFKNTQQILNVCLAGSQGVTAAPELIEAFLQTPSVESNVKQFRKDWLAMYNKETIL